MEREDDKLVEPRGYEAFLYKTRSDYKNLIIQVLVPNSAYLDEGDGVQITWDANHHLRVHYSGLLQVLNGQTVLSLYFKVDSTNMFSGSSGYSWTHQLFGPGGAGPVVPVPDIVVNCGDNGKPLPVINQTYPADLFDNVSPSYSCFA